MRSTICWNSRDIAECIVALPGSGPLPSRAVIVPTARVSHSLRREILEMGHPEALLGTRFLTLPMFAAEVLAAAGENIDSGEETLRSMRLRLVFDESLKLEHFPLELLRKKRGWDAALAATIYELEEVGLKPSDLEDAGEVAHDIATLWRAADSAAQGRLSWPGVIRHAAKLVSDAPALVSGYDTTVALVTSRLSASSASLLSTIPNCELAVLGARPLRQRWLDRLEHHFGQELASAVRSAEAPRSAASDHDILRSYLFEPPAVLASRKRPRASEDPPTSVRLEEHSGVDEELEAAAQWVVEQIVIHETPLEEIAVLVRHRDPLVSMVRDRLQRVSISDEPLPVFVAGGAPVTSTTAGARVLTLLRCLGGHLNADSVAEVLPLLRTDQERRIQKGAALDLAYSLGTVGGSAGHPDGALAWRDRVPHRIDVLKTQLEAMPTEPDDLQQAGLGREHRHMVRQLEQLEALQPALAALVEMAEVILTNASLADLWPILRAFIAKWLVVPAGPQLDVVLDSALGAAAEDAAFAAVTGVHALGVIARGLHGARDSEGRCGDPAVYVGTIGSAVGLRFRATRIIGLAEGSVPSHPRQDAVLPDEARAALSAKLTTSADRSLATLHQFDCVVRFTTERLALSTPCFTLERGYREPSAVFLEVAGALGITPAAKKTRPLELKDMRLEAFRPARYASQSFVDAFPVGQTSWQLHACGHRALPAHWSARGELDLERAQQLLTDSAGAMDGIFPLDIAGPALPGLTPARPVSASRLRTLLECPHRFLYEHVLHWREPAGPRPQRELDPMAFGSLFHNLAEAFYEAHGEAFASKRRSPKHWKKIATALAAEVFEEFLNHYPLAGEYVREQQLRRLVTMFGNYLEDEWEDRPKRAFVATERAFGEQKPVALAAGKRKLWVRGRIDLIEAQNNRTVVRDLKTGKARPRRGADEEPIPTLDLQLGLYAAVVKKLAKQWKVPTRVEVAYVHANDLNGRERAFGDDYPVLAKATKTWLKTATALLSENAFPRTPNSDDCTYCPFNPLCGSGAQARAAQLLATSEGSLELLWELKA